MTGKPVTQTVEQPRAAGTAAVTAAVIAAVAGTETEIVTGTATGAGIRAASATATRAASAPATATSGTMTVAAAASGRASGGVVASGSAIAARRKAKRDEMRVGLQRSGSRNRAATAVEARTVQLKKAGPVTATARRMRERPAPQ